MRRNSFWPTTPDYAPCGDFTDGRIDNAPEQVTEMGQKVVRYGLLSTSQIGINAHLPASRESKNSQIVSISSRAASKAEAAANEHGIDRWFGSYEEQLADPGMDAVINALPISMHCEWTVKAAEAGKHILCEKPLATSAKDCQRMIDAARSNNVVLVEGFTHRWEPAPEKGARARCRRGHRPGGHRERGCLQPPD